VIVALGVLYEYLREVQRGFDRRVALGLRGKGKARSVGNAAGGARGDSGSDASSGIEDDAGLLSGRRALKKAGAGSVCFLTMHYHVLSLTLIFFFVLAVVPQFLC
jgi:copper transporter 1